MREESVEAQQPTSDAEGRDYGAKRTSGSYAAAILGHLQDPFYRNSYGLMANTAIVAGSGFLFWLLAARTAPAPEVGLASAAVSALMFVSMLAKLGFDVSLLKLLPQRDGPSASELLNTAMTVSAGASIVGAAVFVFGTPMWSPALSALRSNTGYAVAFIVLTVIWTSGTLLDTIFVARRRSEYAAYKNATHAIIRLLALPILAVRFGAEGIVLSVAGSMLIALVIAHKRWLKVTDPMYRLRLKTSGELLKSALSTNLANYAVSLVLAAPLTLGSLIILNRAGATEAAIFYILWMFGSVGMIAPTAFGQAALVEAARAGGVRRQPLLRPLSVSSVAALALLLVAAVTLPLIGPAYASLGLVPLAPFAMASIPGYLLHRRMAEFRASGRNGRLFVAPSAAVSVFVVGISIPTMSVTAVGWIWLIAVCCGAAVAMMPLKQPTAR